MSFSVKFSGHHPDGEQGEKRLFSELNAVVSKPEHGVHGSSFIGQFVNSNALHFPQDHPDVSHEHHTTEGDTDLHGDTDARHWAERFASKFPQVFKDGEGVVRDVEGLMLAWFAGAIETGRRAGAVAEVAPLPATGTPV